MLKATADPAPTDAPVETLPVSLPDLPRPDEDSRIAADVKALVRDGHLAAARDRYGVLVGRQQRRASRIAYHFLRDAADADEAVQDAFVKVYSHIESFREDLPFEVWFTRILINGCLDRQKAKRRRSRWIVPVPETKPGERSWIESVPMRGASPEESLLKRERRAQIAVRGRETARTPADDLPAVPLRGVLVEGSQHASPG